MSEFELELQEHELVLDKIQPMESSRRAYRLINGVLVEKTVGEIVPPLTENAQNVSEIDNVMRG